MPKTQAQRRADDDWRRENTTLLACRVYKADAADFKAYAVNHGTTPNALIRGFVSDCLGRPLERRSAEQGDAGEG